MFNFEKLETWQKAVTIAGEIYSATKSFPDSERFGLTSQLRRAVVSLASNIAEGSSRSSRSDFARYVEIATGSLFEVVSQITIAQRQGFITSTTRRQLCDAAGELIRMLSGPRKALGKSPA